MADDLLDVAAFVAQSRTYPVLDVRTPAEFADDHIPGAHPLPLFSTAERAAIGTTYAEDGRRAAMLDALDIVGPKLRALVESAREVLDGREVLMHRWRRGMRSESVGWLLSFFDYRVRRLRGGYKAFRRYVRKSFALLRPLRVLGGLTGSGKTEVLHALRDRGEQVVDLEGRANHRGSVFGGLGRGDQPTQQQFENDLALQWRALAPHRPVWIEDESRRIGDVGVPGALFNQMQQAGPSSSTCPMLRASTGSSRCAGAWQALPRRHRASQFDRFAAWRDCDSVPRLVSSQMVFLQRRRPRAIIELSLLI